MSPCRRSQRPRPGEALGGRQLDAAGFALIEVVVAFTIALLALGVLYRAFSSGLATGSVAARYNVAVAIAQSALDDLGVEIPLSPRDVVARLDGGYDERLVVRPRPDLLAGSDVVATAYPYELAVEVDWREGRRARSITLKTIRLGMAP